MNGAQQFDKQLGWVPAIPLPFYVQRWSWRKFRFVWKAACYQCKIEFKEESEWPTHYVLKHLEVKK